MNILYEHTELYELYEHTTYSCGNGSVPKILHQFMCLHEPIHFRKLLTNYICHFVYLIISGHFLSHIYLVDCIKTKGDWSMQQKVYQFI